MSNQNTENDEQTNDDENITKDDMIIVLKEMNDNNVTTINDITEELRQLKLKYNNCEEELKNITEEKEDLKKKNNNLNEKLNEQLQLNSTLEETHINVCESLKEKEQNIITLMNDNDYQIKSSNKIIEENKRKISELQEIIITKEEEYNKIKLEKEIEIEKSNNYIQNYANLSKQKEEILTENYDLGNKLNLALTEKSKKEEELKNLKDLFEKEIKTRNVEIQELKTYIEKLKEYVEKEEESRNEITRLLEINSKNIELEKDGIIMSLKNDLDNVKLENEDKQYEILSLLDIVKNIKKEKTELENTLNDFKIKESNRTDKVKKLIEKNENENKSLKKNIDDKEKIITEYKNNINNLNNDIAIMISNIKNMKEEIEVFKDNEKKLNKKIEEISKNEIQIKDTYENTFLKLNETTVSLEISVKSKEDEIKILENKINIYKQNEILNENIINNCKSEIENHLNTIEKKHKEILQLTDLKKKLQKNPDYEYNLKIEDLAKDQSKRDFEIKDLKNKIKENENLISNLKNGYFLDNKKYIKKILIKILMTKESETKKKCFETLSEILDIDKKDCEEIYKIF